MKKGRALRLLRVECLESRIIFASDLASVQVSAEQVSMHQEFAVPIPPADRLLNSSDHVGTRAEGESSANPIPDPTSSLHYSVVTLERTHSILSTLNNTNGSIQESNSSSHTDSKLTNHLLNTPLTRVNDFDRNSLAPSSTILSTLKTDPATIPLQDGPINSYALQSRDSINFFTPTINFYPDFQLPLSAALTGKPTGPDNPGIPADLATAFDEYFGLSAWYSSESKSSINKTSLEQSDKPFFEVAPTEVGPSDFFSEYLKQPKLPDERELTNNKASRSLFGVIQSISPFSYDSEHPALAKIRDSILDSVAGVDTSDASTVEPTDIQASNSWKVTGSILAAAFFAVVYQNNRSADPNRFQAIAIRKKPLSLDSTND
jgi:hypothetical protein